MAAVTNGRGGPAAELNSLWILRALTGEGASMGSDWRPDDGEWFEDLDVKYLAGLLGQNPARVARMSPPERERLLHRRLAALERASVRREGVLFENARRLGQWFGLSEVEQEVLLFAVSLHTDGRWQRVQGALGELSSRRIVELLAQVLGHPEHEIARALAADGVLGVAGLVRIDHSHDYYLTSKLDVLEGLAYLLLEGELTEGRLIETYVRPSERAECAVADFPHLDEDAALLISLLGAAVAQAAVGVNVLLYGWTGTGKSAFARALTEALSLELYAVSAEDAEGAARPGRDRLNAYRLAQRLLARNGHCLILFDEVEDAFPQVTHPFFGIERRSGQEKAWMNRLLETNPVPAIWVSNEIEQIDPAFRRRFAYALELPTPPVSVRAALLHRYTAGLAVHEAWIGRMARDEHLTPGRIAQAARVAQLTGAQNPGRTEAVLERVLRTHARALDLPAPPAAEPAGLLRAYSPKWVCADPPLGTILKGLEAHGGGARLCLYGPPGSGKSAFARHLTERLGRPLHLKRASDLLGPYVGETEARLAATFRAAQAENAALLLDEIDGLLQRREAADHGWKVTQVNELLQQMEDFEGLLLATTNRLEALDAAVLRRFDLKVRFDYLDQERAWTLFVQACTALAVRVPRDAVSALQTRLARLSTLTPGDFATAVRRLRLLSGCPDAHGLAAALEEECRLKPGGAHRPIGFVV